MKLKLQLFVVLLLVVLICISFVRSDYFNRQTKVCQVTGKEAVHKQDSNQYRIYTTCGTYVVEDSLTLLRFDSADVYGNIVQNTTYQINSSGIRIPFLNLFPNIISVEKHIQAEL